MLRIRFRLENLAALMTYARISNGIVMFVRTSKTEAILIVTYTEN